ncbi:MAG TPA: phospholipid carrier-dependent glycosyltransferase [Thermoanaerobaculia bacterium]|nr:phospholipid carrier-dependent glycosyltransferase [Thermoanaerobaculia bacterium]
MTADPTLDPSAAVPRIRLLQLWLLLTVMALFVHLGGYPLYDSDEGRNGEVGREMATTHDYVMPRLDGLPYLDKPVLYFAAEAAAMEILGPTETAARLPALLFTLATAAIAAWFARRVLGAQEAWIVAIVTLAMPLTLAFSRTVIFDSALTFFITLAIIAFYFAVDTRLSGVSAIRWTVLAWGAMGFGVLTKGPVAIALPLLVAVPYAIYRKAGRALWSWAGLGVFTLVIAPWVVAISRAVPDFLHYVLVTETVQRLATKALKRTGPPWYFIPYLLGGALPWSIAIPAGWRASRPLRAGDGSERRIDPLALYLVVWIAVPFVFFSLSQSKRPQYILPLMPVVALLVALVWRGSRPRVPGARVTGAILSLLGLLLIIAPLMAHPRNLNPDFIEPIRTAAIGIGAAAIASGVAALAFSTRKEIVIAALTLPVLAIPLFANPLLRAVGLRRSAEAFAAQLRQHVAPETELIGIEAFSGSMAFYLRHEIVVATPDAQEMTSNYLIRHYDRFTSMPSGNLRSMRWLDATIGACCAPRIYIVRNDDGARRRSLEARGLRLLAEGAHFAAYGIERAAKSPPR